MRNMPDKRIDRANNDGEFRALVQVIKAFIYKNDFTPQEIRDALFVAAFQHAQENTAPVGIFAGIRTQEREG